MASWDGGYSSLLFRSIDSLDGEQLLDAQTRCLVEMETVIWHSYPLLCQEEGS